MKKINLLLCGALLLGAGLFSSCTKDDTNDTTISFAGDTGFTAKDATVTAGGTFTVRWTIISSTKMGYMSILKDGSAYETWSMKEIPSASNTSYIAQETLVVPTTVGTYTYSFVVYDKDQVELARKSIVITVTAAVGNVTTLTTTLGSATRNTTDPSFYSIGTSQTYAYNATGAAANADFGYLYGDDNNTTNYATLFSPEWTSAQGLTQKITSPTHATKFAVSSVSAADFDAITTSDASIITAAASATSVFVNNLQVGGANAGKIIAFVSQSGRKGLIKVGAISSGSDATYPKASGTVALTIKVQTVAN
jgi:hypothetical protein